MPAGSPTDSPEIVQLLIDNGAELGIKNNNGNAPFMISASTNGIKSMKILIKLNINLNEINNNNETGLIQAFKYGYYENVQILVIFYKKVLWLKLLFENLYDNKYNLKKEIND